MRPVVVLEHVLPLELLAAVRVPAHVRPEIDLMVQLVASQLAISAELLVTAADVANEQIFFCFGGREAN